MPWPNDVVTRVVTGTYLTGTGSAARGRVVFSPNTRVVDEDDAVVIEDAVTAPLDATGYFEIELPTTDNELLNPKDWYYEVSVRLYGVKPQKFYAVLPYGDGSPVDIVNDISLINLSTSGVAPISAPRGLTGPRGPGVLTGEGFPPDSLGFDGDIYIDSISGNYYGPKTDGTWPGDALLNISNFVLATPRHVHTQASPSSTWVVTHPLGGRPSVTVVDSSSTVVIGQIDYNSDTQVTITFSAPFSGYAYLT